MNDKRKSWLPLFAVILLPSMLGVVLISLLSWQLFDPAVERSSGKALSVVNDLVKGAGNAALSYPVSADKKEEVEKILKAITNNPLVFAAQVRDIDGNLIARHQNDNLPIEQGIQIVEYREKLYYEPLGTDPADQGKVFVGEVLYQLTPHVVNVEKERLRSQFRTWVIALVALVLGCILLAARMLLGPMKQIKMALGGISRGEAGVHVSENSAITEIQSIQRGVNQLSQSVKEASVANGRALAEKENALHRERTSERESQLLLGITTREIADPVMKIVELLRINRDKATRGEGGATRIDTGIILECAEQVQVSLLGMMGKLREQRVSTGLSEIALGDYFLALSGRYAGRFSAKGLQLKEKLLGCLDDATYKFDVRMVDIVLEKVLENALLYTEEGTVTLKWAVNDDDHNGHILTIVVEDSGRGIDRADIDRVFDRYYRARDVVSAKLPGSGLGLYIAREIVEALGGSICAESEATYGSRFNITLPIAREEATLSKAEIGAGKTVLLVGVQKSERHSLDALMSKRKMVFLYADTSIEGLVMLGEQGFDYIVIEESVSDPDADSFIEEVKKQKLHVGIGVLSTGHGELNEGIHFMGKPVRDGDLAELLAGTIASKDTSVDYRLKERFESNKPKNDGAS